MKTIVDLFEESVSKFSSNPYILEKENDKYLTTTYKETHNEVYRMAAGLMSMGVKKGDHVALLSEGRKMWVISELAILYAGACNIPLSVKLESPDLKFRLEHSETSMVIVSGGQAPKIDRIKDELPNLKTIIYLNPLESYKENEFHVNTLFSLGDEFLLNSPDKLTKVSQSIKPNDFATISYTSGTTADPKGVILSHRNYTANVEQALTLMDIPPYFRTLVILPLDHCFAHVAALYSFMAMGASIASVQVGRTPMETLKNIPVNIREIKPNILLSVPALAKNFKKNIEAGIKAKGGAIEKLFNHALKISYAYNGNGYDKGQGGTWVYKPLIWLYDKILFKKIRAGFGGELKFFIGGGALLDIDLQKFFYAIGMPMLQGYGLSEATPIISSNSLKRHKLGSSGYLVKYLDLKICNDQGQELPVGEKGEIVVKGENVMQGYYKNTKTTAETIKDGWLHTGDMGYMDSDGFLYVLGRFKSLLIGGDGEKYSPEGIEESLMQYSPLVDQVILYNNQNTYTIGLIVPSKEGLKRRLKEQGIALDSEQAPEAALNAIASEVARFKTGGDLEGMFPDRWLPATFAALEEDFTDQNGLLNSTLKVVRGKVEERYKDRIELLYSPEGKNHLNDVNRKAMGVILNG